VLGRCLRPLKKRVARDQRRVSIKPITDIAGCRRHPLGEIAVVFRQYPSFSLPYEKFGKSLRCRLAPWLRAIVALNNDKVGDQVSVSNLLVRLILRRVIARQRRRIIGKLNHYMQRTGDARGLLTSMETRSQIVHVVCSMVDMVDVAKRHAVKASAARAAVAVQ
jgi:hypothetical protein